MKKKHKTNDQNRVLLPALIIPGFMSSGLEVQMPENPKEHGKRVWLNLQTLGFYRLGKIGKTGSNDDNEEWLKVNSTTTDDEEYQQQLANKKSWIQYMSLQSKDMVSEHVGCRVRPIGSLEGVDYLTDNKMTQLGSYVFGPLINELKRLGYTERHNLDAAPYDWRLPPSVTEERDQYLTNTMNLIQTMYQQNNNLPVVLICHSMGCKMGHYLLNFIKHHPQGGQDWIDEYIHTFVVVGAPHLGVSKTIRASVTGDKMTLDAFLSDEDGLKLGRSLGSVPWMMPSALPIETNPAVLPTVIKRREGLLEINFETEFNIKQMLKRRKGGYIPSVLRLCVVYGNETAMTDFKPIPTNDKIRFDETFCFAAPPTLLSQNKHQGLDKIQFLLQEPGTHVVEEKESTLKKLLCCPFKWCLCCPCTLIYKILQVTVKTSLMLSDQVMATLGTATITASTGAMRLKFNNDSASTASSSNTPSMIHHEMSFDAKFMFQQDKNRTSMFSFLGVDGKRYTSVKVHIKHISSHDNDHNTYKAPSSLHVASLPILKNNTSGTNDIKSLIPFPLYHSNKEADYVPLSGLDMLQDEGLDTCIELLRSHRYEQDPLGPRSLSASEAPPIQRVHAIYGINVPTEISAIYKRRSGYTYSSSENKLISKHVLDQNAKLDRVWKIGANTLSGVPYELKGGILYETSKTPQRILTTVQPNSGGTNIVNDMISKLSSSMIQPTTTFTTRKVCGDGTVPYWNLHHVETWKSSCKEVKVDELEGAEHREILADPRFHRILENILIVSPDTINSSQLPTPSAPPQAVIQQEESNPITIDSSIIPKESAIVY